MKKEWQADRKVPGLGLMVLESGVRTWYLRYREPGGKQQTHKIGRAEVINVTTAREEARKLLADAARGLAPTTARKEHRNAPTMQELRDRVEKRHWPKLRAGTRANNELVWRLHLLPVFGTTKIVDLERRQVVAWFHEQSDIRPVRANRCLEVLSKAMNLAELWELRPQGTNPCKGIESNRERKRKRYLTSAELKRLLAALDNFAEAGIRWRFAQLIRLLLLTGCRINEIMSAPWEWLDLNTAVLTLPPEAHKTGGNGDERRIHLPPQALLVLEELRARSNSEWIIAGDGDGHLVGYWHMWADLLEDAKIQNLRVHDLRHSWASYAITQANLTLPQVGAILGHASPQTTQRYAHLMDEAAAGMAAKVAALIR
jgi:integrase